MFKKQYQKANDEIPLNEELLASLLETVGTAHKRTKTPVAWIGVAATAAVVAIGVFSYSHFGTEQIGPSDSVADRNQTNTKVIQKQEPKMEEQPSIVLEESTQTEITGEVQHRTISVPTNQPVFTPKPVIEESPKKSDDKDVIQELPVTASATTPRVVPTDDKMQETASEETKPFISSDSDDSEIDVVSPPVTASIGQSDDLQVSGGGGGASLYPQVASIGGSSVAAPSEETANGGSSSAIAGGTAVVVGGSVGTSYLPTPTPTPTPDTETESSETEE